MILEKEKALWECWVCWKYMYSGALLFIAPITMLFDEYKIENLETNFAKIHNLFMKME